MRPTSRGSDAGLEKYSRLQGARETHAMRINPSAYTIRPGVNHSDFLSRGQLRGVATLAAGCLCVAMGLLSTKSAMAGNDGVVVYFDGSVDSRIRDDLSSAASNHLRLVDDRAFRDALRKHDARGPLIERLGNGFGVDVNDPVMRAANAVKAAALVVGRVDQRGRTGQSMRLVIIDVYTGEILSDETVKIAKAARRRKRRRRKSSRLTMNLSRAVEVVNQSLARVDTGDSPADERWAGMGGQDAVPVGEQTTEAAAEWQSTSMPEWALSEAAPGTRRLVRISRRRSNRSTPTITLGVGALMGGRRHAYKRAGTNNLRPYEANRVPGYAAEASLYPLAWASSLGPIRHVGVEAMYSGAVGLKSAVADAQGSVIRTDWNHWRVGGRIRIPISRLIVEASGTYGRLTFDFDPPDGFEVGDELPGVRYEYARVGLRTRLALGALSLRADGGYLYIFSSGTIGDSYFPKSRKYGIDANLGVAVKIVAGVESHLLLHYTQIAYDLRSEPNAHYVARSALDQYFTLELGLTYSL